ncbi:hypothetical protein [Corynebacterium sp. A21]|uniref:hypothetical protein n=1 Tax=Corynebacterium sp. A21 TaxID=3457318 RepID=UPI003FD1F6FD
MMISGNIVHISDLGRIGGGAGVPIITVTVVQQKKRGATFYDLKCRGDLATHVDRDLAVGDLVMAEVDSQSLTPHVNASRAGSQVSIVAHARMIGTPLGATEREKEES